MKKRLLVLISIYCIVCACCADNNNLLLLSGTQQNGVPLNGKIPSGATVNSNDGKLSLKFDKKGSVKYRIFILPDMSCLYLKCKLTTKGFKSGEKSWETARIAVRFYNDQNKMVGGWLKVIQETKSDSCSVKSIVYDIPKEAKTAVVEPANFGKTGSVEYSDLVLCTTPENLLLSPNPNSLDTKVVAENIKVSSLDGGINIVIDGNGKIPTSIPLPKQAKQIKMSMQWKLSNVVSGKESWKTARIALRFYGTKGAVGKWPKVPSASGSTDWEEFSCKYVIPEGAVSLSIEPANFGKSGKVEIKNLRIIVEN